MGNSILEHPKCQNFKCIFPSTIMRVSTFRWSLVHGLPRWTWSMDYLNRLPMDYPKWTTLNFVADMNFTMLEPRWNLDKRCDWSLITITDHLRLNRFNPQLDLCLKTLEKRTSGWRGRILASCPFAAYVGVVRIEVRDKCDYIYAKIPLTRLARCPFCERLLDYCACYLHSFGKWSEIFGKSSKTPSLLTFI